MPDEVKALFFDILRACELISEFTANKNYSSYKKDFYCKSAVERQFQIIGEAINRLVKNYPDIAARIPSYRNIIDFRNIIVHGYDRVEDGVVWGIVCEHLPALRSAVKQMFEE